MAIWISLGEPKLTIWPKVPLVTLLVGLFQLAVIQDVEEVGTELHLPALCELEPPADRHIEVSLPGSVDGVASEVAELTAEDGAGSIGAGALECGGVQVRADSFRRGIHLVGQDHIGAVEALAAEGNVLAVGDLDRVAGEEADDRRNLPVFGEEASGAGADSGAVGYQRVGEVMPVVISAIAALPAGAVERILVEPPASSPAKSHVLMQWL